MPRRRNAEGGRNNNNQQQTIVLSVYLHCEECAKPMIKCLRDIEGVEEVVTSFNDHKLTVKGHRGIDPRNVVERLRKKCNKEVILASPRLNERNVNQENRRPQPQIVRVTLSIYIHCDNCGKDIKQRIERMTGVQTVDLDMANSKVVVKGEIQPDRLAEYVDRRMGKQARIMRTENITRANRRQRDNGNNTNPNNEGTRHEATPTNGHIHGFEDPDFRYAAELLNDENSEACIIM